MYAVNKDITAQSDQISVLIWGYCFACRIAERGLSFGGSDGGVSSVLLLFTFSYFQGDLWDYKCILGARGDNTEFFLPLRYRKIVWKLIFYPINASANTISHDFFSTVHTFPIIQLIFLGPLLNWFCWVHLEPVAIAELHKFDFFFFFWETKSKWSMAIM